MLFRSLSRVLAGAACLSPRWASGLRSPRWLSCLGPSEDVLWGPGQARVAALRWGDVGWPCPHVCFPFHTWRPRLGRGQLTEVWLCLALAGARTRCSQTPWRARGSAASEPEAGVAAAPRRLRNRLAAELALATWSPRPRTLLLSGCPISDQLPHLLCLRHTCSQMGRILPVRPPRGMPAGLWAGWPGVSHSGQPRAEPLGAATPSGVLGGAAL